MENLKEEVIKILTPIFGASMKDMIEKYYDDQNPQEIISITHELLSKFMGEKNANKEIEKITMKFPKISGVSD